MLVNDPSKMSRWRVARLMGISTFYVTKVVDPVHPPERITDARGRVRVRYDRERVEEFAKTWQRKRRPKRNFKPAVDVHASGRRAGRVARWLKKHPRATIQMMCAGLDIEPEDALRYLSAFRMTPAQLEEQRQQREHEETIRRLDSEAERRARARERAEILAEKRRQARED